jgi:hypothetical protein
VRLTDLAFDDWLEHVFGHEVRFQQAAWFFDHDRDWWDREPTVAVEYLTRLFEHPVANVPGMLALFNKSRPALSQRFDESLVVALLYFLARLAGTSLRA